MDDFSSKRELCEIFKSKNREFTITFDINSQNVQICVRHFGDWDKEEELF